MAGAPHQGRVGLGAQGRALVWPGWGPPSAMVVPGGLPRPAPPPYQTHLQGQLVSEEGADEVAGIPSNPAQKEPQRQRLVHVPRPAGFDVLAAAEEGDAGSGQEGARAREEGTSPVSPSCWQGEAAGASRCPLGILTRRFSSNQGTQRQLHLSRSIHSIPQTPLQSTLESPSRDLVFCVRP